MDIYMQVQRDVTSVFELWERRDDDDSFSRVRRAFMRVVDPRVCRVHDPRPSDAEYCAVCLTEWLLFEGLPGVAESALEWQVCHPGPSMSVARLDRLRQLAQTQRFSSFAICERRPEAGEVVLQDLRAGDGGCDGRLVVRSPLTSERETWGLGMLSLRIARVDGTWLSVGKVVAYDRSPLPRATNGTLLPPDESDDERLHMVRRGTGAAVRPVGAEEAKGVVDAGLIADVGPVAEPGSYFLAFLHDLIGYDGRYAGTFRMRASPRAC